MKRSARTLLASAFAVAAAVAAISVSAPAPASAASSSRCPGADATPVSVDQGQFATSVLCLLNIQRTKRHLKPLRGEARLAGAATGHTVSMRAGGYFAHDDPSGATFETRIEATGYIAGARRWLIGENLGWGETTLGTPRALMAAWMKSPPHRANILERRFREIGIGVDWGTPDDPAATGAIVTTDFGLAKG